MFNIGHPVSSYTKLTKHGPRRILKFIWWLLLVRLAKVELSLSFGVYNFTENLNCRYTNDSLVWKTASLDQVLDTAPLIRSIPSRTWYPTMGNIHCLFHQSMNGWARQDNGGAFKPWFLETIPIQTYSWPERWKIKHLSLLLVSRIGSVCG